VSLSLSHSFRKFLGLQVLPFSKPAQLPEGPEGQNDKAQMSLSSTRSNSMTSRAATRLRSSIASSRFVGMRTMLRVALEFPQAENCRSKFGCSQDRSPSCSKSRRTIRSSWCFAERRRSNRWPSLPDFTEMAAGQYGSLCDTEVLTASACAAEHALEWHLSRGRGHTVCVAEGDIYCPGVHLDFLQTMANLACGTSWDACLAPGSVDRVLEIAKEMLGRGKWTPQHLHLAWWSASKGVRQRRSP